MKTKFLNKLNSIKIYLIGNLENENEIDAKNWRHLVTVEFAKLNITCLDPLKRNFENFPQESLNFRQTMKKELADGNYNYVRNIYKNVRRQDLSLVDKSDAIFCVLNPDVPTWGTCEELSVSTKANKPIFLTVKGGKSKTPLWITSMIPENYNFDSIEDAIRRVKDIDAGLYEIDEKYWRLLLPNLR